MRRRKDFELAVRRGKRARGKLVTAYLFVREGEFTQEGEAVPSAGPGRPDPPMAGDPGGPAPGRPEPPRTQIGFVVSRAVGTAVVRNRVRRRLRHLARARADLLPAGSLLVIRADPRAADARQRDLAAELDLVLAKLLRRQVRALDCP
jgi:ribonuclease P protein component